MPVAPSINPSPKPEKSEVQIATNEYKHSIVTSEKMALEPIIAYIGGSNWTVDWLSQIQNEHESLKPFDIAQQAAYQMYHYINKMIVKLQGSLTPTDDTDSGRMSLTGTLMVPAIPGFIPNQYDAFIADIGEGRAGQFTVTHIQKNTLNRGTVYTIDFKLDRMVDDKVEKLIRAKIGRESYYEKDLLILGQNPLLTSQNFHDYKDLNKQFLEVVNYWASKHFSRELNTVVPPLLEPGIPVYDLYVVRAIRAIISQDDVPRLRNMTLYNCDDFRLPEFDDLFTAMIKRDRTRLYGAFQSYKLVDVKNFVASAYQASIRYSGFRYILVPNLPADDPDYDNRLSDQLYGVAKDFPNYSTELSSRNRFPQMSKQSYVFSAGFYSGDLTKCSLIELAVNNLLDGKVVDPSIVFDLIKDFYGLPRLEQFYFGVPLFILIKEALRGIS